MKKKIFSIITLVIGLSVILLQTACNNGDMDNIDPRLIGYWETDDKIITAEFTRDDIFWGGTMGSNFNIPGEEWTAMDGKITCKISRKITINYNFNIKVNTLTLRTNSQSFILSKKSNRIIGEGTVTTLDINDTYQAFSASSSIAIDNDGNIYSIYSDSGIKKIDPKGIVSTLKEADPYNNNSNNRSRYSNIVVDTAGNVFVTDERYSIKKITPEGVVTTFAGGTSGSSDGTGTQAQFSSLRGMTIDSSDNLYVTDDGRIRKITPAGVVTTIEIVRSGSFNSYGNLYYTSRRDEEGNEYIYLGINYIAINNEGIIYGIQDKTIRMINEEMIFDSIEEKKILAKVIIDIAGGYSGMGDFADGTGFEARFDGLSGITIDNSGNLYVTDKNNYCIRKVTREGVVTTISGSGISGHADGKGTEAQFTSPQGIAIDKAGNLYVSDSGKIRKITF